MFLEKFLRRVRTLRVALRAARNSPVHSNGVINYAIAVRLFRTVRLFRLKNFSRYNCGKPNYPSRPNKYTKTIFVSHLFHLYCLFLTKMQYKYIHTCTSTCHKLLDIFVYNWSGMRMFMLIHSDSESIISMSAMHR